MLDRINRTGTTVVMATHDQTIVDQMRRRVVALRSGQVVRDEQQGVRITVRGFVNRGLLCEGTWINVRRNLTLTVAAILTVAVGVMLVGLGLMARYAKRQCAWSLAGRRPVRNFLRAEHCWRANRRAGSRTRNHPDIERIQFITRIKPSTCLKTCCRMSRNS